MNESTKDNDQLLKRLLKEFFEDFVTLVAPEEAKHLALAKREMLEQEQFTDLPRGDRRTLDLVAKVPRKGVGAELVLLHVEIEGVARSVMAERMFEYFMQL